MALSLQFTAAMAPMPHFVSCCWLIVVASGAGCLGSGHAPGGGDDKSADAQGRNAEEIDHYIRNIDPLPPTSSSVEELGDTEDPYRTGDYLCRRRSLTQTREYDQITAYSANSESIWPGALLHGDAIRDGLLSQVVLPRRAMTYSVDLAGLELASASVGDPSLSSFRESLNRLLAQKLPADTPANIYVELEEVHSEKQLDIAFGFEAGWSGNRIKSLFSFEDETVRSRFLLRYVQSYYTVDLDPPSRPSSVLKPTTTMEQVRDLIPEWDPPLYVSSLTYGRTILFTFESEHSSQELRAAIEFAFGLGKGVSGRSSVTHEELLERTRITAHFVGGAADDAARAVQSLDELGDFIVSGATFAADSPGVAIAYKLAYLRDSRPARLSMTRDYEVLECERISQRVLVRLLGLRYESGSENQVELYGQLSASSSAGADEGLFDRSRSQSVPVARGTSWPTSGIVSEVVVDVEPRVGGEIAIHADMVDRDGSIFDGDDRLGGGPLRLPHEGGWRGEKRLLLTGGGLRVEVDVELVPL